jgi:hypothetical protein
VLDAQLTLVASVVPNLKAVAPLVTEKPVPFTVTVVPPAAGPPFGVTLVTVGVNLKRSADDAALVPFAVVTVRSTVAGVSLGDTAVIVVADTTLKLAAGTVPKWTAFAVVRFVPVIVTVVPPATPPLFGLIFVTVGGGPDTTVHSKLVDAGPNPSAFFASRVTVVAGCAAVGVPVICHSPSDTFCSVRPAGSCFAVIVAILFPVTGTGEIATPTVLDWFGGLLIVAAGSGADVSNVLSAL